METHAPTPRQLLIPGAFVLACVVLSILTWLSFGGSLPLQPAGYRITIPLPDASNLYPGADVRMAGVTIGKVISVRRTAATAAATVQLDAGDAPLRSGARALLRTKSLLGEGYLELAPGPVDAPLLRDGAWLRASHVAHQQSLDDVLQTFSPTTRARLRQLIKGLSAAVADRSQALNDALGDAAPATANLATVMQTIGGQQADLRQLVAGSAAVLNALGGREGTLRAAVTAGDQLLSTTAQRDRALAATIAAFPAFLAQLRASAQTLGAASGDLDRAAVTLAPVARPLVPALQEVSSVAPQFRALFAELPPVLRVGERGLPAARRIFRAAPPALEQLYPAARQVIPVLQLLGAVRSSMITTFANVAAVFNGTYVGPGQRILDYVNGWIQFWNESISGWVKRLPTHRGNTYPKPGAVRLISSPGGLASYDCRYIHNPEYLPPFGSVAPCKTQGPWTYRGVRAYYPHLQPAPP